MKRALAVTVAAMLLSAGLGGCGGQAAVCDAVDELNASVDNLRDMNISENGLGAISDGLSAIRNDLRQVRADAEAEYAAQVEAVNADVTELTSSVQTAQEDPSSSTFGGVRSALSTLVDDVALLADDVQSTC